MIVLKEAHFWIIVYIDGSKQAWCLIQILAYSVVLSQYLWYLLKCHVWLKNTHKKKHYLGRSESWFDISLLGLNLSGIPRHEVKDTVISMLTHWILITGLVLARSADFANFPLKYLFLQVCFKPLSFTWKYYYVIDIKDVAC